MATDALHVDRTQSNAMNLQVLKRQDADVVEIVDTASHVVMYEFDQDAQSWVRHYGSEEGEYCSANALASVSVPLILQKRKDVEGCLFVVKRSSAPRFQIFVNNRLSTTNMTLPLDDRLQVDNVDSFLILRSPDTAYSSGYAIYGVWFFPEEDRGRILQLLQRLIQSLKAPQSATIPDAPHTIAQSPVQMQNAKQQTSQPTQQQEQQQERPPSQSRNRGRSRNKREDSKRRGANANQPIAILQRSPKDKRSNSSSSGGSANGSAKQENAQASGMLPISKADGIAAGEAIMGMISQNRPQQQHKQPASPVNKEQLKQTLIGLLDDTQFFDQIYHAYVNRVSNRG
ncbi:hypothetical protein PInf_000010 [Phytophthora infestans]|nr:hypothetical protein PInf_000010 [Phytophthora infestans]